MRDGVFGAASNGMATVNGIVVEHITRNDIERQQKTSSRAF